MFDNNNIVQPQVLKHEYLEPNFKKIWRTSPKQIRTLLELFTILGMLLLGWLTKSMHVCSIGLNHLINIPYN
jgi:hypothetical protein